MAFKYEIHSVKEAYPDNFRTVCLVSGEIRCTGGNIGGAIILPDRYANKKLMFFKVEYDLPVDVVTSYKVLSGSPPTVEICVPCNTKCDFEMYFEIFNEDMWVYV